MDVSTFDPAEMGKRIKRMRKKKKLTQEDAAAKLNMRRETFNTIEAGKRALKDSEIAQLAAVLDTSCDYLLRGIDTENLKESQELGLTNTAIKALKGLANQNQEIEDNEKEEGINWPMGPTQEMLRGLNIMLSHHVGRLIMMMIYRYSITDFSTIYELDTKEGAYYQVNTDKLFIAAVDDGKEMIEPISKDALKQAHLAAILPLVEHLREEYQDEQTSQR